VGGSWLVRQFGVVTCPFASCSTSWTSGFLLAWVATEEASDMAMVMARSRGAASAISKIWIKKKGHPAHLASFLASLTGT